MWALDTLLETRVLFFQRFGFPHNINITHLENFCVSLRNSWKRISGKKHSKVYSKLRWQNSWVLPLQLSIYSIYNSCKGKTQMLCSDCHLYFECILAQISQIWNMYLYVLTSQKNRHDYLYHAYFYLINGGQQLFNTAV